MSVCFPNGGGGGGGGGAMSPVRTPLKLVFQVVTFIIKLKNYFIIINCHCV